jgi:hydroxymethylbilane synthase
MINILKAIQDPGLMWMALSERAMLRTLQGGCSSPVAVSTSLLNKEATINGTPTEVAHVLRLNGTVVHPSGMSDLAVTQSAEVSNDEEAEALGVKVAEKLFQAGAKEMLAQIREEGTNAYNLQKEISRYR